MKYLGIDYGTKKIGLAVSDPLETIAFPKKIIPNDTHSIDEILKMLREESIGGIVIGKSLNLSGEKNMVQKKIDGFMEKLKEAVGKNIPLYEQDERMTSVAARSHLYGKGNISKEHWTGKKNKLRKEAVDAGAAALILQRFLDRQK